MPMREFATGATRASDTGKPDYEGFLSPTVLWRFGQYMVKHRVQTDGKLRDSDNWQKGIPEAQYLKSLFRHFIDVWLHHRGQHALANETLQDALCGILFNAQGYLHEQLKGKAQCQTVGFTKTEATSSSRM